MAIGTVSAHDPGRVLDGGPMHLVTLSMTAHKDYLALARISATQVGTMLDLPPARVCDLRLAVDEACACFLADASRRDLDPFAMSEAPEAMELSYDLFPGELHVTVRAAAGEGWPEVGELSWAVLTGLSNEVRVHARDGLGELTLVERLPGKAA